MSEKHASNRSNSETITPLSVPKINRGINEHRFRRRRQLTIIALICSIIFLVAAGAWFLHFLSTNRFQAQTTANQPKIGLPEPAPQTVTSPDSASPKVASPEPATQNVSPPEPAAQTVAPTETATPKAAPLESPPPPAVDSEKIAMEKQMAEQKLAEFLEAKKTLDDKGADGWGGQAYLDMVEIGRKADSLFIKNDYRASAAQYERATVAGRQLAEQTHEALQRLLEEGRRALADGNGIVAQEKFNSALMIEPNNQSALKGLKRAQTIETVVKLIEAGKQHESDNALSLAQKQYKQALEIDPEAQEARRALARVTDLIREQQYQKTMSAGLTALHNNDLDRARSSLLKAKSLKPGSREVKEALLQLDQADRLRRIDRLHGTAQKAERSEDWQTALAAYVKVLEIDKNVQFAISGKERARQQIRLTKRLDFYLSSPRVLESDKHLKNATLLLHEANEATPRGRELTRRTKELARLVALAQTPVILTIESDNLTDIAVYKVGKLGRFSQHELTLRPGTYTVVGARDGYQDVRRKIVVKPGQQSLRVTVKCRVKI